LADGMINGNQVAAEFIIYYWSRCPSHGRSYRETRDYATNRHAWL